MNPTSPAQHIPNLNDKEFERKIQNMNIFEGNYWISHSCVALELYIYIYVYNIYSIRLLMMRKFGDMAWSGIRLARIYILHVESNDNEL